MPEDTGTTGTGGTSAISGGSGPLATGGANATGGRATGGNPTGGTATGGKATGGTATGGKATGGSGNATGGGSTVDCATTMPTGGTDHCGANTQGTAGGLSWSLWSNAINSSSCITTYNTTAFGARWNNSGDFLARVGIEWTSPKPYAQYGTISAQFSYTKTGTGGGYSYIGIYGWSNNPCVEYYIVDDRYGTMPFNAYNATLKGTATIDGESYKLFSNSTTGSGGNRCGSSVTNWQQYWSIRQTARQCGTISITQHFDAWNAVGLTLGNVLEAKILVEVGGGSGSISFPVANVTAK